MANHLPISPTCCNGSGLSIGELYSEANNSKNLAFVATNAYDVISQFSWIASKSSMINKLLDIPVSRHYTVLWPDQFTVQLVFATNVAFVLNFATCFLSIVDNNTQQELAKLKMISSETQVQYTAFSTREWRDVKFL